MSFAAIDPYLQGNIVLPTETRGRGDMVNWGENNAYPDYLLDLYNNVPTLRSIVMGNVDYITGDEVTIQPLLQSYGPNIMNTRGDTIREQVRDISKDYEIYGGFALQVIRNFAGDVAEVYYLDMRYLRSNKDNTVFYYCEDWQRRGRKDVVVYPAFIRNLEWGKLSDEERNRHASSILFVKTVHTQVYPAPLYAAAVKACEIERCVADYHLNAINNGFTGGMMVNFNNGVPDDKIKEEIEEAFTSKYTGSENAGRVVFSWNKNKESATEIVELKTEDFGEKYKALSETSRRQIFTAFRAIPLLFGLTSEANTGFSTDEFEQSYKLYNRTQIRPVQRLIGDVYDKIYGVQGVITFRPFSLESDNETNVN